LRTIPSARDEYRGSFTKDQQPEPLSALPRASARHFPVAAIRGAIGNLDPACDYDGRFKDAAAINARLF
jgi:hypothetical protein